MTEQAFEARLTTGLREMADAGTRPFDPSVVAEAAVAPPGGAAGLWPRLVVGETRRWISLAAALLLLAALVGLAVALVGSRRAASVEQLAFVRNGDIWVANLDGTGARLLAAQGVEGAVGSACVGVQWSRDGSRLAAPLGANPAGADRDPRRIAILAAGGASLGSLAVEFGSMAMAWSPSGNHLAVLAPQATKGGLWLFDGSGKLERELALPPPYRAAQATTFVTVSWSPDGRFLAVTGCPCDSGNHGSWIVAVDGSGAREIRVPGDGHALSLAWSPDGTRVAIGTGNWAPSHSPEGPGELWAIDVDGGSAARIATTFDVLDGTAWSPDSRWIAYSEPNAVDVVRADGSGEPLRVPGGSPGLRWSSQPRLYYLVAPQMPREASPAELQAIGSIMAVDPSGGEPTVVIDHVDALSQFDIGQPPPSS